MMFGDRVSRAAWAALLALYGLLYGRALQYDFVWDDSAIEKGVFSRPLGDVLTLTQQAQLDEVWLQTKGVSVPFDSYRPLLSLSYWLDVHWFGVSARAMHAHGLLLGLLNVLLAYAVVRRLRLAHGRAALLSAALFALHPLALEPVVYISARADLLAGTFTLSAVLLALASAGGTGVRRLLWALLSGAAFAGSILTKEAHLALPLALLALALPGRSVAAAPSLRGMLAPTVAQLGALFGVFWFRSAVLHDASALDVGGALASLLDYPGVLLDYTRVFVMPFELSSERLYAEGHRLPGFVLTCAASLLAGLATLRGAPERRASAWPFYAGLVWFGAFLATAPIGLDFSGVAADRYAYTSLLGLCTMSAEAARLAWHSLPRFRGALVGAGVLVGLMWLSVSWLQAPVWQNNLALYGHAAQMEPSSSMANYRLGYVYARTQRWPEALGLFERALSLDPENMLAQNNLGVALMTLDRCGEAVPHFRRVIELTMQKHYRAWYNLGLCLQRMGDVPAGCAAFARAHDVNAAYVPAKRALDERCATPVPR
jgi:hypothetical protein